MNYKLTQNPRTVQRLRDGAFISEQPARLLLADWDEYLDFLAAGGVPDPADPAPPLIPPSIQALRDRLDEAIADSTVPARLKAVFSALKGVF